MLALLSLAYLACVLGFAATVHWPRLAKYRWPLRALGSLVCGALWPLWVLS